MFFFKSYVASYGYVHRPGTDRIPEGVKKVAVEQESLFLWKKCLRNEKNRNPEDSCRKMQPRPSGRWGSRGIGV